ncbi:DgyrCDS2556 [Dimorphilus gyrociliatus]|uniref:DgyrCDS2556 n=1 Tax=Dimorphilus gyrociliatus TaxID=2664684 RepID=A0A7I8VB25_9ANNE|nr:DgyrCDS2556 [Dimorphilus gyrociliatus]
MGKISLELKARLENVTNFKADGEDFRWYLKLKCLNCGEETPDFVYLTLTENQPLKGGRGHASLVLKCKLCNRENSIDIIKDSIKEYLVEDFPKFKPFVTFDCRGVEPSAFSPRTGFKANGTGDRQCEFEDIDLKEEEWCDYDEKNKQEVGIYELEYHFKATK